MKPLPILPGLQYYIFLFSFTGELRAATERDFGSLESFRAGMTAKTIAIQGSGWGWLVSANYVFFSAIVIIQDINVYNWNKPTRAIRWGNLGTSLSSTGYLVAQVLKARNIHDFKLSWCW